MGLSYHLLLVATSLLGAQSLLQPHLTPSIPFPAPEAAYKILHCIAVVSSLISKQSDPAGDYLQNSHFSDPDLSSFMSSLPTACSTLSTCMSHHFNPAVKLALRSWPSNFFEWNSLSHLKEKLKSLLTSSFLLFSKTKPVTNLWDSFFTACFSFKFLHHHRAGLLQQLPDPRPCLQSLPLLIPSCAGFNTDPVCRPLLH